MCTPWRDSVYAAMPLAIGSAVLTQGHTGQLPGNPTTIGAPC